MTLCKSVYNVLVPINITMIQITLFNFQTRYLTTLLRRMCMGSSSVKHFHFCVNIFTIIPCIILTHHMAKVVLLYCTVRPFFLLVKCQSWLLHKVSADMCDKCFLLGLVMCLDLAASCMQVSRWLNVIRLWVLHL